LGILSSSCTSAVASSEQKTTPDFSMYREVQIAMYLRTIIEWRYIKQKCSHFAVNKMTIPWVYFSAQQLVISQSYYGVIG
jgi:hypothetical protein